MSNHASCARAGMLLLPHGTCLHPSHASVCSAGTCSATTCLLRAVRHRRQQGGGASTAGDGEWSRLCFPLLWHAAVDSLHTCEPLKHAMRAVHAAASSGQWSTPHTYLPAPVQYTQTITHLSHHQHSLEQPAAENLYYRYFNTVFSELSARATLH